MAPMPAPAAQAPRPAPWHLHSGVRPFAAVIAAEVPAPKAAA